MRYTTEMIAALQPRDARYEVPFDVGHPLFILVQASGSKSFCFRGRVAGKSVRKVIGTFGKVSLKEAKQTAEKMKIDAADGGRVLLTTTAPVKTVLREEAGICVDEAWALYWDRDAQDKSSGRHKHAAYVNFIKPAWAARELKSITRMNCAKLVDKRYADSREAGDSGIAAVRFFKVLQRFFNWCAKEGYGATGLEVSPMANLVPPMKEKGRARTRKLDPQEIVWFFQALAVWSERGKGDCARRLEAARAYELLLRSVCRRANIFDLEWEWIGPKGITIPGRFMKNDLDHVVPLTETMVALIGPRNGVNRPRVFQSKCDNIARHIGTVRETMTEVACLDGVTRNFNAEPYLFRLHDFRRTATTYLATPDGDQPFKTAKEVRESILAHKDGTVEGEHYNAYQWYRQKQIALQDWNAHLDGLKAAADDPSDRDQMRSMIALMDGSGAMG